MAAIDIAPTDLPRRRTLQSSDREKRSKQWTLWLLMLFPIAYAGVGQLLGQDVDFDLQNYHFFDSYWVLVNHMHDAAPAQLQTYLSPILDIPFYFAAEHFPPRLTGFLLALVQGLSFPLLYLINRHFTDRRLIALSLAGLGMLTAGAISEIGTIFGDTLLAPACLAAILLGLRSLDASCSQERSSLRPTVLIVSAGGIAGLAAGLKFSTLPIAAGTALAFLFVSGRFVERVRKTLWATAALIVGTLVSYGWWGYELATHYGNPILPYMNQFFHSPYASSSAHSGTDLGVFDILFDPFVWTLHPALVTGLPFREWSMPILELLLIAVIATAALRSLMHGRRVDVFNTDEQRFLVSASIISYLLWVREFDQYRFLIPIEMLSFTLIFICLQALARHVNRNWLVTGGVIAIAMVCLVSEQPIDWGRSAWSPVYFSATVPRTLTNRAAAFLMLGTNPDAFVVPYFPKHDYFAQIQGNLPPTVYLRKIIVKDTSAYTDVFVFWETQIEQNMPELPSLVNDEVEPYGYEIDSDACARFPVKVGTLTDQFHACRLRKVLLSELVPTTQVVKPTNAQRLTGRQWLDARAFSADGLRKVEFVISGGGRTVESKAVSSFYGWLGGWNTETVPNGSYVVQSVAFGVNGRVAKSAAVAITVTNTSKVEHGSAKRG